MPASIEDSARVKGAIEKERNRRINFLFDPLDKRFQRSVSGYRRVVNSLDDEEIQDGEERKRGEDPVPHSSAQPPEQAQDCDTR